MHELEFIGLDGSNLLAYLAALGTLRVLAHHTPQVRMSWREKSWWTPVIHSEFENADAILDRLTHLVCGPETLNEACRVGKDLSFSRRDFGALMDRALQTSGPSERLTLDFLSGFGSDAFGNGKDEQIATTALRAVGGGQQRFLGSIQELASVTGKDDLCRTLFANWDYADERPSLRWDSNDYRPHALRAEDPSGDPIRTMRGANRLAVEALPLFTTAPSTRSLLTTAFADRNGTTEITWPIWLDPIEINTIRSLLGLNDLQSVDPDVLRLRGIVQAFRAARFTDGKYRNFTSGRPLL